jgi:hypothetical protein
MLKVKDLTTKDVFEMPERTAILRAIKGEVEIQEDLGTLPIFITIQEEITKLRSQTTPVPQEVIKKIERQKFAKTWNPARDAMKALVLKMFSENRTRLTMQEIREAANQDPYLKKYPNSHGQRVRQLVKEKVLGHYFDPKKGREVEGIYVLKMIGP